MGRSQDCSHRSRRWIASNTVMRLGIPKRLASCLPTISWKRRSLRLTCVMQRTSHRQQSLHAGRRRPWSARDSPNNPESASQLVRSMDRREPLALRQGSVTAGPLEHQTQAAFRRGQHSEDNCRAVCLQSRCRILVLHVHAKWQLWRLSPLQCELPCMRKLCT